MKRLKEVQKKGYISHVKNKKHENKSVHYNVLCSPPTSQAFKHIN
jgi:hypothetical protein